ncbi:hypothetical protein N9X90_01380 [Alphaproteobacteria bacterium]|nr:hypothetical protein [Alphaproteobacteria bacterium]
MQKQPNLNIYFKPEIMPVTVPQFSPKGQVMHMMYATQITAAVGGIMPQLTFGALTA